MTDEEFEDMVLELDDDQATALMSIMFDVPLETLEARLAVLRGEEMLTFEDFDEDDSYDEFEE